MPAAAVIPAPIAYVKIAAVKKLVVGFLVWYAEPALRGECLRAPTILLGCLRLPFTGWSARLRSFTLKKLECLKQAFAMNTLAWNNKIGLRFYFVGF